MKDILLALKFAYRHTIGSGRPGFFDMLVQGVEVMEVEVVDLMVWGFVLVVAIVLPMTLWVESIRVLGWEGFFRPWWY